MTHTVFLKPLRCTQNCVAVGLLLGALWSPFVWADDYTDVNRLFKGGQAIEAMAKVDQFLVAKPRDPQMRFLKGVILAETGKASEAIATFVKLTEEFPELPEPYNNLAVLYASQNQLDKARVALEMAIRTNPSYDTAHENLGDVYAKLASQAYSKALQLDGSNVGVPQKLALIRNLFTPDARVAKATSVVPASSVPVTANVAAAKPTPTAAASAVPVAPNREETQDVIAAVQAWAKAWANKDMAGYLGAYDGKFDPPGKQSRKSWEAGRTERIVSKRSITVDVSDFEVKLADGTATATFRQHYKAGNLVTSSRKVLDMTRQNGRWLIVRESNGN